MSIATEDLEGFNKSVVKLCEQSTNLVNEVKGQKSRFDEKLVTVTNKTEEAKGFAQDANDSRLSAMNAETGAFSNAARAEAAANKAAQVSGLETVEEAVALACEDLIIPSESDFRQMRSQNKESFAASGFVEWGMGHSDGASMINEGMWAIPSQSNVLVMGRSGVSAGHIGKSRTDFPKTVIAGVISNIMSINYSGSVAQSKIKFPEAPNGAVIYDSDLDCRGTGKATLNLLTEIDPKYGNVADSLSEAVARAFEGWTKNSDFRYGDVDWIKSGGATFAEGGFTFPELGSIYQGPHERYEVGKEYKATILLSNVDEATTPNFFRVSTNRQIATLLKNGVNEIKFTWLEEDVNPRMQFSGGVGETLHYMIVKPVTEEVVINRQDMFGFEYFLEEITEAKPMVYKGGNVQTQVGNINGISAAVDTTRPASYYAVFDGDEGSVGKGVNWFKVSKESRLKILADEGINIFRLDDGRLVQWRVRQRTIAGLGNGKWHTLRTFNKGTLCFDASLSGAVKAQGKLDVAGGSWITTFAGDGHSSVKYHEKGIFECTGDDTAINGMNFFLVCGVAQRLNQGAYHPVLNPLGCNTWWITTGADRRHPWHLNNSRSKLAKSQKDAFDFGKWDAGHLVPFGYGDSSGGNIGVGFSGRQDQYQFHDAIYAGLVQDLRLSAHKQDVNKLREDAMRKAVAGDLRGKSSLVVTSFKVHNQLGTGNHHDKLKQYTNLNLTQGYILVDYDLLMEAGTQVGDIVKVYDADDTSKYFVGEFNYTPHSSGYQYFILKENHGMPPNGTGLNLICVIEKELPAEFDSLPWVDVIGSPERIAATFPNGVVGQWITDQKAPYNLNKKVKAVSGRLVTINDGEAWRFYSDFPLDVDSNSMQSASYAPAEVALHFYEALSNFTESDDNLAVIGELGDVVSYNSFGTDYGNRLQPSLVGTVNTSAGRHGGSYLVTQEPMMDPITGKMRSYSNEGWLKHSPLDVAKTSSTSDVVKALPHLVEKNGQLFLQLHGTQLKCKDYSDGAVVDVTSVASPMDVEAGKLYRLAPALGTHLDGRVILCSKTQPNVSWGNYTILADGAVVARGSFSTNLGFELWNGSGWGDDSSVPIIDGEGTKTDLNGATVKVVTHSTLFPLGWADYSTSSQSMKAAPHSGHSDKMKPANRFNVLADVPEEIREFYREEQVLLSYEREEEASVNPETGSDCVIITETPVFGVKVEKLPAYYENGGHIDTDTVAAWNFHDAYIQWMEDCAEVDFYNSTPQYTTDDEGDKVEIEFEPLPLPAKPSR